MENQENGQKMQLSAKLMIRSLYNNIHLTLYSMLSRDGRSLSVVERDWLHSLTELQIDINHYKDSVTLTDRETMTDDMLIKRKFGQLIADVSWAYIILEGGEITDYQIKTLTYANKRTKSLLLDKQMEINDFHQIIKHLTSLLQTFTTTKGL